jgi:isopropylmalate/homocitrate/citramalate synthase
MLVCEVGPRDGLQSEEQVLSVEERVQLVDRLTACGFARIEVGSFVSPARVPQMAGAEEVFAGIQRSSSTEYVGLVLNLQGAVRALHSGTQRLNFAFVVTETFNQRNQGRTRAESLTELEEIVTLADRSGVPVTVILGSSFGCPFEGPVPVSDVLALAERVVDCGAAELVLSDTIGVAVPSQVRELAAGVRSRMPDAMRLGCHFHNTRNTGLANAVAALAAGATLLDASVGGAGGCPFAPGATGNIPTEDLLFLLSGMGHETGVDVRALIEVAHWLEERLGHRLPGMVKEAGIDWHVVA